VGENGTRRREDFPAHRRDCGRLSPPIPDIRAQSDSGESAHRASAAGGAWKAASLLLRDAAQDAAADDCAVLERRRAAALLVQALSRKSVSRCARARRLSDSPRHSRAEGDEARALTPISFSNALPSYTSDSSQSK